MNGSFENIFEKFNISCDVPRKRYRSSKACPPPNTFHKRGLNISSGSSILPKISKGNLVSSFDSSCYLNINTKRKYYNPTRYKTLEIVGAENAQKNHNSISENQSIYNGGDCNSKENNNQNSLTAENIVLNGSKCGTVLNNARNPSAYCRIEKGNSISSSVSNTRKSSYFDTFCYCNTNTKRKYYKPTRYKTLDIAEVKNIRKHPNYILGSSSSDVYNGRDYTTKENNNDQNSFSSENLISPGQFGTILNNAGKVGDYSQKDIITDSNISFNNDQNDKNIGKTNRQPKFKLVSLNESNNSLSEPLEDSFTTTSDTKNNEILTTQPVKNNTTELDLLIDLIEQEEKNSKTPVRCKQNGKFSNHDDILPRPKSCLKGGYQEVFERALKQEKVKGNFLKYDKKVGLRSGQILTVLKIETSYGLTLAIVGSKEKVEKKFAIAVAEEMAPRLKIGTEIEAFFDDNTLPYKLEVAGECLDVYLEPYKLLIV